MWMPALSTVDVRHPNRESGNVNALDWCKCRLFYLQSASAQVAERRSVVYHGYPLLAVIHSDFHKTVGMPPSLLVIFTS